MASPEADRGPFVLDLADPAACAPALAGAKAANLAAAAAAGFPVIPGFVLTTAAFDHERPGWDAAGPPQRVEEELRDAWRRIGGEQARLVVRSSSTVEDIGTSSMAGQFLSLLGITGWPAFVSAVEQVQRSAQRPAPDGPPAPMAVLIQQQVAARTGGVMFGMDPVTGDRDHILVEAVPGGPEQLVSGTVTAQRYLIGRRGRLVEAPSDAGVLLLDRRLRRRLAALAERARRAFGGVQDVEWAVDGDDRLWLLQTRPVTAVGASSASKGPLLGPGPVGETFPELLRPLEEDLWLDPLRCGVRDAIALIGAVPSRVLAQSPVVASIDGRAACDLTLLGAAPQRAGRWRRIDPRAGLRRSVSAWRVGRLRAVLPELAVGMCRRVDAELTALPPLDDLSDPELQELLQRVRGYLASVHGHEVLAGALLPGGSGSSAAGTAMTVLRRGRALGLADEQIAERWPVVLALTAPRIGGPVPLPPMDRAETRSPSLPMAAQLHALPPREALRLRARWLQEVTARAADLLAARFTASGRIRGPDHLPRLRLAELADAAAGWPVPSDLGQRRDPAGPPLPSCFRLAPDGTVVRVRFAGAHRAGGRGASQGRAAGTVVHDPAAARQGDILVTRTLDPRLAPWLPSLAGVVCETGGVLSHLAILARECGVPTVVGVHEALDRFPAGTGLLVDGTTGEVRPITDPATPSSRDGAL